MQLAWRDGRPGHLPRGCWVALEARGGCPALSPSWGEVGTTWGAGSRSPSSGQLSTFPAAGESWEAGRCPSLLSSKLCSALRTGRECSRPVSPPGQHPPRRGEQRSPGTSWDTGRRGISCPWVHSAGQSPATTGQRAVGRAPYRPRPCRSLTRGPSEAQPPGPVASFGAHRVK